MVTWLRCHPAPREGGNQTLLGGCSFTLLVGMVRHPLLCAHWSPLATTSMDWPAASIIQAGPMDTGRGLPERSRATSDRKQKESVKGGLRWVGLRPPEKSVPQGSNPHPTLLHTAPTNVLVRGGKTGICTVPNLCQALVQVHHSSLVTCKEGICPHFAGQRLRMATLIAAAGTVAL